MSTAIKKTAGRSLAQLLAAQPMGVKRHPGYVQLLEMLARSQALRAARLSRAAWGLLDAPRLETRFAGNFRKTYRMPPSPFFEEFLIIKWDVEKAKSDRKLARALRIRGILDSLPEETRLCIEYLKRVESTANRRIPVWKERLSVKTIKRANELASMTIQEWIGWLCAYRAVLVSSYGMRILPTAAILSACLALGCFPDPGTGKPPSARQIKSAFRTAVKRHHPDSGGIPARFRLAVKAKELLEIQTSP